MFMEHEVPRSVQPQKSQKTFTIHERIWIDLPLLHYVRLKLRYWLEVSSRIQKLEMHQKIHLGKLEKSFVWLRHVGNLRCPKFISPWPLWPSSPSALRSPRGHWLSRIGRWKCQVFGGPSAWKKWIGCHDFPWFSHLRLVKDSYFWFIFGWRIQFILFFLVICWNPWGQKTYGRTLVGRWFPAFAGWSSPQSVWSNQQISSSYTRSSSWEIWVCLKMLG